LDGREKKVTIQHEKSPITYFCVFDPSFKVREDLNKIHQEYFKLTVQVLLVPSCLHAPASTPASQLTSQPTNLLTI
jgi:hypothetical protein